MEETKLEHKETEKRPLANAFNYALRRPESQEPFGTDHLAAETTLGNQTQVKLFYLFNQLEHYKESFAASKSKQSRIELPVFNEGDEEWNAK